MSGIFDYVLRHNRIEFIGEPTLLKVIRWTDVPTERATAISLTIAHHGIRLSPREAIVLGNALIDIANNSEHWKHPPLARRL
jgi:hypothetical protein